MKWSALDSGQTILESHLYAPDLGQTYAHQAIICLSFDKSSRNIWTGDQHGNLTETLVDIPEMAKRLKASLKRDLTREEWNYYIGRSIPYETFKGKEARP